MARHKNYHFLLTTYLGVSVLIPRERVELTMGELLAFLLVFLNVACSLI